MSKPAPSNLGIGPFALRELLEDKLRSIGAYPRRFLREQDRARDRLYASELGHCARAVWLGWRNPQPHDEHFDENRGALGHAVEEMHAERVAPITAGREVSYTNHQVSGRVDFALRIDGEQIPEEVKSTYAQSRALNEPSYEHVLQLAYYMKSMEAPYGLLTYINLANYNGGSGEEASLRVPWTPALAKLLQDRIEYLWALVHQDVEPQCEDEDPSECFWCKKAKEKKA